MVQITNISRDYKEFCQKADEFIEGYKKFFKEELEKNGKDIKEICKMRTYSDIT